MIVRQQGSDECGDRVKYAFNTFENLVESRESEYLQERLRLCQPLDPQNDQELAVLLYQFINTIATYIQRYQYVWQ